MNKTKNTELHTDQFKILINRINNDLSEFIQKFRQKRQELTGSIGVTSDKQLFVPPGIKDVTWSIDDLERVHFYIEYNEKEQKLSVGLRLGSNKNYKPFESAYSSLEHNEEVNKLITRSYKERRVSPTSTVEDGFIFLHKNFSLENGQPSAADYNQLLDDITGDLYSLYVKTSELAKKNQPTTENYTESKNMSKELEKYTNLLKTNKNLIFTGAPGTGKSYLAKAVAKHMDAELEFVQFHPSYDYTDFVEGLRPIQNDDGSVGFELRDGIFKAFCKKALKNVVDSDKSSEQLNKEKIAEQTIINFLDECIENAKEFTLTKDNIFSIIGYDTSDILISAPQNFKTKELKISLAELIELLIHLPAKPKKVKEIREYFRRKHNRQIDSYMYTLLQEINRDNNESTNVKIITKKYYVIILDEINRAEISKVFGELFFSIDPGYRGKDGCVKTQYSNLQSDDDVFKDGFYIPENVYIIGTMNDIDRSVESFDFAMRRRFSWQEIKANDTLCMWDDKIDEWKEKAKESLQSLNQAIESIQGLDSSYHIGGAYFLKLKNYNGDFAKLWDNHIHSLLFEYLRGYPDAEAHMETLKKAYDVDDSEPSADNDNANSGEDDAGNDR